VIIQNRDGSIIREQRHSRRTKNPDQSYYAAVPAQLLDEQSSLIDRLISFAFDTLGMGRLEVRVYDDHNSLAHYENCC
jgi:hypothetical protein